MVSTHLSSRRLSLALVGAVVLLLAFSSITVTSADVALTQLSSDPYTNANGEHKTEAEPDTFSFGSTIVAATQVGRFYQGGADNIGWATSKDNGATWTHGYMTGITKIANPANPYDQVTDPSVAYDSKHNVWLISSLPIIVGTSSFNSVGVIVNRSTDGGLTWTGPVTVSTKSSADKDWIVCDNTSTSPYYGNCYIQWDNDTGGKRINMSTSIDGGLTWGKSHKTANFAAGIGGQPLVQPNGTVIVPLDTADQTAIRAFKSKDGGASWSSTVTVATLSSHLVAGGLRSEPFPSAEIDASGKVYIVWQDCRFRTNCSSNDIVMSSSTDGTHWSTVTRIPIDSTSSTVDHFIPGLGVDKATSGSTAHLGLAYYYYPVADCSPTTCQLEVGFISSPDGGSNWNGATQLAGPMMLNWLASTGLGPMVGDYISTSFAGGTAHPVFAVAYAPVGSVLDEAIYSPAGGLSLRTDNEILKMRQGGQ